MDHDPIIKGAQIHELDASELTNVLAARRAEVSVFTKVRRSLAAVTLALTGAGIAMIQSEANAEAYPWESAQPTGRLGEFAIGRDTYDKYGFAMRNCTSYAAWRMDLLGIRVPYGANLGNAGSWDDNAPRFGYPVDTNPNPGDIAVWDSGHVAFVESVDRRNTPSTNDDLVTVSEYNAVPAYGGRYSIRQDLKADHYIHFQKTNQTSPANTPPVVAAPQKPNVYEVLHANTRSGRTEIKGLDGKVSYTNYIGGWAVNEGLHSGADMDAVMGDFNKDGAQDAYVVMHWNTGSGKTEVRILDGASNYGKILGSFVTPDGWHGADDIDYALGDVNRDGKQDLLTVLHQNTPSGRTEVRVLDAASNFSSWLGGWVTPDGVHSSRDASYVAGDLNKDGAVDVMEVLHQASRSGRVEVKIFDGKSNFQKWQNGWTTPEGWHAGSDVEYGLGDFNQDGKLDLYEVLHQLTRSGRVEVKILDGSKNFQKWLGGWVSPEGWHGGDDVTFVLPTNG